VLTRLMIEMNDVFAAFATAGAGLWGEGRPEGAPDSPQAHVDASLYSVIGTNDNKIAESTDYPLPFPIAPEAIVADPLFSSMLATTTEILSLDMAYTTEVEQPAFVTFTFDTSLAGNDNQYKFRMVNNMGHVYPSGDNNRWDLNVADLFWEFFTQYTQP
jgi:hypothetical protein